MRGRVPDWIFLGLGVLLVPATAIIATGTDQAFAAVMSGLAAIVLLAIGLAGIRSP